MPAAPTSPGPARGAAAGAVCAVGGVAAHHLAGGSAPPGALTLVFLGVTALLGRFLSRGLDPARLGAAALLGQVATHVAVMTCSSTSSALTATPGAEEQPAGAMLTGHLLVAAVTVAVGMGLDRELLRLAAQLADELVVVLAPSPARLAVPIPPGLPAPIGVPALGREQARGCPGACRAPPR